MLWELWNRSQAGRCLPSDLVSLRHPIKKFYFDRGITFFGRMVENELAAVENQARKGKAKRSENSIRLARQHVLDKYIGVTEEEKTKRYKDPAVMVVKNSLPQVPVKDGIEEAEQQVGLGFLG